MTSRLTSTRRRPRYFEGIKGKLAELATPLIEVMRGPWGGYTPDLTADLSQPKDAEDVIGIRDFGGELLLDSGFDRVDTASLPLGSSEDGSNDNLPAASVTVTAAFNENTPSADTITRSSGSFITDGFGVGDVIRISGSASNNGFFTIATILALTITLIAADDLAAESAVSITMSSIQPVTGFHQRIGLDAVVDRLAMTSNPTLGRLYELVAGSWGERPYDSSGSGASAGISGSTNNDAADTLFDTAYHPASDTTIITNDEDRVYVYPRSGSATEYTDFNDTQAYGVAGFNFGGSTLFKARSVETQDGRVIFLNTVEDTAGTDEFPTRVRWTNISGSPTLDTTVTGSGFIDLDDVQGIGLRVIQIGNSLACYFDTGVVFLRRTFLSTAPYKKEVVSQLRGILSTHSIVNIGSGVHFGVFNDGWFFLDSTGRFIEAGTRNVGGKVFHKWKERFFSQLDFSNRARIVIGYDHQDRVVRISFPDINSDNGDPNTTWVYDIDRDTVWPMEYQLNAANIWGNYDDLSADVTWATVTGTWDTTSATWNQFGVRTARNHQVHGTTTGIVYRHSNEDVDQDGVTPSYRWTGHERSRGAPSANKRADKLHVGYIRIEPDPPQITAGVNAQDQQSTGVIQQTKGADGDHQIDFVNPRLTARRMGITVSGAGPVRLTDFQFHYLQLGNEERT